MTTDQQPYRKLRNLSKAFTLVELMVSMTVFALMLALVGQVVADARNSWSRSASRISQFRDARLAFELITRNVGQATLNTYFDYEKNAIGSPQRYVRQSELHFICGHAGNDAPNPLLFGPKKSERPGHAIFFQAYLGHTLDPNLENLGNLLNGRGYYVQYTDGTELAPKFLGTTSPKRWRYRLWEWLPAAELDANQAGNQIYDDTIPNNGWFNDETNHLGWSTSGNDGKSRLVAENVIALLISPRASLPEPSDPTSYENAVAIAPNYHYDTRSHGMPPTFGEIPPLISLQHVLPPLVQITLVAIDEPSAIRLEQIAGSSSAPDLLYGGAGLSTAFETAKDFEADLRLLEDSLNDQNINYRIFSTTVSLRSAKWDSGAFTQ